MICQQAREGYGVIFPAHRVKVTLEDSASRSSPEICTTRVDTQGDGTMAIELPELPYAPDALAPVISERTVDIHYNRHHAGYVNKVNAALQQTERDADLLELIRTAEGGLYNNAAQVWNHTFYWRSMTPASTRPSAALEEAISAAFGSMDACRQALKTAAANEFGSGWAWLVQGASGLQVLSTTDAVNPVNVGLRPLLTIDVWEHAYYLDFQNERGRYLDQVVGELLDWEFASANLAGQNDPAG